MKMKHWLKKGAVAGMLMAALLSVAGCGNQKNEQAASSSGYPVSWTETLNGQETKVSVDKAPARVISMSQATSEMLLTLGLEDRMVGTAMKEEEVFGPVADAYGKVKVLSEKWPSYETFMAEKPDFATGWEVAFTKRGIPSDSITSQGVPIYIPSSMQKTDADLETVFTDMLKLGDIFGVQDKAKAWVDSQKKELEQVQKDLGKQSKKRVFVYDASDGKPFTAYKGYTTNILKLIGAENIMENAGVDKTWAAASWESVVAGDPEYIIICDYSSGVRNEDDFKEKVATIRNNPQLKDVKAVKENKFIKVRLSEITPGVRTVDALKRLAAEMNK